jgi:sigma-B regulation protein RsbU (phosphoserine phosphatase)
MYVEQNKNITQSNTYIIRRDKDEIISEVLFAPPNECIMNRNAIDSLSRLPNGGWSEPYKCERDGNLVALFYAPVTPSPFNPGTTGFVACEISLEFLNNLILETKVGERGFAFLLSNKGYFVTHPIEEYILSRSLFNLPETVFKGEIDEIERVLTDDYGSITVYPDPIDNERSIAYHTRISNTGWILITTLPYSEINRDMNKLIARMIAVILLVIFANFLAVFYISNKVITPLSKVTHEIQSFSNGRKVFVNQAVSEAEVLASSLKRLRKMYDRFTANEELMQKKSEQIQTELQITSEIQKSIIPEQGVWKAENSGVNLYSVFKPAHILSGDLYDFFMVDEKHLLITIGDVSGSGVAAALFMGVAHAFIKSFAKDKSPKDIVKKVNKELCRNNHNQFFITLFIGIINVEDGNFTYCNAGHTPAVIIRHHSKIETLADPHGLPLGLYSERGYNESYTQFGRGDKLILYTDGITEQRNKLGKFYGESHLLHVLKLHSSEEPQALAESVMQSLENFVDKNELSDDLCLVIMEYEPKFSSKLTRVVA